MTEEGTIIDGNNVTILFNADPTFPYYRYGWRELLCRLVAATMFHFYQLRTKDTRIPDQEGQPYLRVIT